MKASQIPQSDPSTSGLPTTTESIAKSTSYIDVTAPSTDKTDLGLLHEMDTPSLESVPESIIASDLTEKDERADKGRMEKDMHEPGLNCEISQEYVEYDFCEDNKQSNSESAYSSTSIEESKKEVKKETKF